MQIISNNPMVKEQITQQPVIFIDGSYGDVLIEVKRLIVDDHHILLSHPLSGSIKPNETFYKSILITTTQQSQIDMESLDLIDQALNTYEKFNRNFKTPNWPERVLEDFATIDLDLLESTLQRIRFSPEISVD
ncbi:GrdX family protein [Facklamia languida]